MSSSGEPFRREASGVSVRDLRSLVRDARHRARGALDPVGFVHRGATHWRSLLEGTHLAEDVVLRGDAKLVEMAWTVALTDRAIDDILQRIDDPVTVAAVVARLAEGSQHTFEDPLSGTVQRSLTAAKRHGTYFTPIHVAEQIARFALRGTSNVDLALEPGGGTGMLTVALLVEARRTGVEIGSVEIWELDRRLAAIAERTVQRVTELLGARTTVTVRSGDAIERFAQRDLTPDVIVMNAPYGRLKFLRSSVTDAQTRAVDPAEAANSEARRMRDLRARHRQSAIALGLPPTTSDLQTLFLAGALHLMPAHGRLAFIAPASWTTSVSSAALRSAMVSSGRLEAIVRYAESEGLFDTVNQPTAVAAVGPRGRSSFTIADSRDDDVVTMEVGTLDPRGGNPWRIPDLRAEELGAYRALRRAPRLGDAGLTNRRGEVDLTLDAGLISDRRTPHRLVRGDHLERYELRAPERSARAGHLTAAGARSVQARPKGVHSERERIAGRQVSYMGKARRLSFARVPAGVYLANSCNYLVVPDGGPIHAVLAALNSSPLDWWFKVHSSNNHLSNLEIDDLPWPFADQETVDALDVLGREIERESDPGAREVLEDLVDAIVLHALGAAGAAAMAILKREVADDRRVRITGWLAWLQRYGLPDLLASPEAFKQHTPPTLSALDRQMIAAVGQGGNWQDIPESVPSARLDQIRAMSRERGIVRTTYYGRLRPDQPAYTIATYYNRPGNGTNIHPHEDRTLTNREAARLQSFPDTYRFLGGDGAVRKQIGNAVPPLLGRAIGQALTEAGHGGRVVDLFAGAGGLSAGLEQAGLELAVAVDNDASCEKTYTFNRPSELVADPHSARTLFVRADLSDAASREATHLAIRQKVGPGPIGVLVGGPPCQGFSHAGFRSETDDRNDLAIAYLDFVRLLAPAAVVIENVEGLLSYRRGAVVAELRQALTDLGYECGAPWLLAAEQFGVPQMRRRVFIVATRNGAVAQPQPLFERCLGRREPAGWEGSLPYPITVDEALAGLPALGPSTHPSTGARVPRELFASYFAAGDLSAFESRQTN